MDLWLGIRYLYDMTIPSTVYYVVLQYLVALANCERSSAVSEEFCTVTEYEYIVANGDTGTPTNVLHCTSNPDLYQVHVLCTTL